MFPEEFKKKTFSTGVLVIYDRSQYELLQMSEKITKRMENLNCTGSV